jgi:CrcB protein
VTVVALALAGGLGALLRFGVERAVRSRLGPRFPWGTLVINVSGSFALGVLVAAAARHHATSSVTTVLGVGLLGAYTTFSTFTVDTAGLIERRRWGPAAANVGASLAAGLAAGALGLALGHVV